MFLFSFLGPKLQGIHKIEGDTLTSCLGKEKNDLPKEFATKQGVDHGVVILKKQKP